MVEGSGTVVDVEIPITGSSNPKLSLALVICTDVNGLVVLIYPKNSTEPLAELWFPEPSVLFTVCVALGPLPVNVRTRWLPPAKSPKSVP